MLPQPLLQVPVASQGERGMLGIAVAKHKNGPTYVFLYFTESGGRKTGDDSTARYHNGGKIVIGPDKNVYVGIGDVNEHNYINGTTQAENAREAPPPDGRGGILRITQNGEALHGITGK